MSVVSIEINSERILLVAGRKAANRPLEVSHVIEVPIESKLDDAAIAEKLKQAVQSHSLGRCDAVVVLSRSESELREIELPPSPDDELPDMVMFKAKSDFASFDDNWLLDFVSLDNDESKPRKVLASAIAPKVRERVERIIEPTGLKLKRLVLRPFAVMDLLKDRTSDGVARLVVNRGDNFTDVVVAKGNQTVSARSIRISSSHDADQRSTQLVSEVRRTLASSRRSVGGSAIEGVILVDDEKTNKHLVGNLSERLGMKVDIVDPFDGLHRIGQAKGSVESPWQFTPLLGSLINHEADSPAIDFLNPSRREVVEVDRKRWWLYGAIAVAAAIMTGFFGWWTLSSQTADIARLEQDLVDKIELNEGDGIRPSVETTLGRTGAIDGWQRANVNWLDEIAEISKRTLTADEAVVAKFDAAVKSNQPQIEVTGKIVGNEMDKTLFESLESRPYDVDIFKSDVVEGDADYPYVFGKLLAIERNGSEWLKDIDSHVREFKKTIDKESSAEGSVN